MPRILDINVVESFFLFYLRLNSVFQRKILSWFELSFFCCIIEFSVALSAGYEIIFLHSQNDQNDNKNPPEVVYAQLDLSTQRNPPVKPPPEYEKTEYAEIQFNKDTHNNA